MTLPTYNSCGIGVHDGMMGSILAGLAMIGAVAALALTGQANAPQSVAAAVLKNGSVPLVAMPREQAGGGTAQLSEGSDTAGVYVPSLTFDVASIRETKPDRDAGYRVGGRFTPFNSSNLNLENNSFSNLLQRAYPGEDHKMDGFEKLPSDLRFATFDVRAKGDEATDQRLAKLPLPEVQLEQEHMVQVLLAERFHLKVHWETRESSTYDLVVIKRNRLQTAAVPLSAEEVKAWEGRTMPPLYQRGDSRLGFQYIAHGATSADIAQMLAGQFGAPVNDKTGLTGKYYFDLKTYQTRESDRKDGETNPWPPLETAIQDQLGLKLVQSRGPVRFLVIDHAEMPSAN